LQPPHADRLRNELWAATGVEQAARLVTAVERRDDTAPIRRVA